MDKQKQIEEMAKVLRQHICEDKPCQECKYHGNSKILEPYCEAYIHARMLYNAGYRKIPEGAVVLTNNNEIKQYEWSKMCDKMGIFKLIDKECKKTRKETAEKFSEMLKEVIGDICFNAGTVGVDGYVSCSAVNPNTVIERIDEICEEFIGDKNTKNEQHKTSNINDKE